MGHCGLSRALSDPDTLAKRNPTERAYGTSKEGEWSQYVLIMSKHVELYTVM